VLQVIKLTKLNKKEFYLNSAMIETIESTPDTVITLRNGKMVIVVEPPEAVIDMIIDFGRKMNVEE